MSLCKTFSLQIFFIYQNELPLRERFIILLASSRTLTFFFICFNDMAIIYLLIWRLSGVSIVNFEHISHFVLVFLLLTLSR